MIWYRSCIVCTLLVYISSFKLFLVWMLYKFCTVCTFFVYIEEFDVHFLYIHYQTKFWFVQSLYTKYIQINCFVYFLYTFCIVFVQFFVGKGELHLLFFDSKGNFQLSRHNLNIKERHGKVLPFKYLHIMTMGFIWVKFFDNF